MSKNKYLYIIRHGQTEYNKLNIIQGSGIDSDLNVVGRLQAESFYDSYYNFGFDLIYTSELKRTIQSVHNFISDGVKHISHHGLNEINWGILEGTQSSPMQRKIFEKMVNEWKMGNLHERVEGGESPLQMKERQLEGINHILKSDAQKILISSHGRALRSLMCLLTGQSQSYMYLYPHTNLGLYILEQTDEATFRVLKKNDTSHLADALITAHF